MSDTPPTALASSFFLTLSDLGGVRVGVGVRVRVRTRVSSQGKGRGGRVRVSGQGQGRSLARSHLTILKKPRTRVKSDEILTSLVRGRG